MTDKCGPFPGEPDDVDEAGWAAVRAFMDVVADQVPPERHTGAIASAAAFLLGMTAVGFVKETGRSLDRVLQVLQERVQTWATHIMTDEDEDWRRRLQ